MTQDQSTLHILANPLRQEACFSRLISGDGLILLGDARKLSLSPILIKNKISLYLLKTEGASLSPAPPDLTEVDFKDFVSLVTLYKRSESWF